MTTKTLANNYGMLTPEERFSLIMAAIGRGDEVDQERLTNASKRITFSSMDYSSYAHAFQELQFSTYDELLDDAAFYLECLAERDQQLRNSIEADKTKKTISRTKGRTRERDDVEWPDWHRSGRMAYAVGFLFKAKLEGWSLFCKRINIWSPVLWDQADLPGLDRIRRAFTLVHAGGAFTSAAEMAHWVNEVGSDEFLEHTEADVLTAEQVAADLDATFRDRVKWWGG